MLTKLKKSQKESERGFTIIEVMIVLAIAGLILLIVFLAIPALQRNSRNTSKKSDASKVMGALGEHVSNNNGNAPVAADVANIQTSANLSQGITINGTVPTTAATVVAPTATQIEIVSGATCNAGANVTVAAPSVANYQALLNFGGSARSYAVIYSVEAAGNRQTTQCLGS